jgi:uncharacterized membrane protein
MLYFYILDVNRAQWDVSIDNFTVDICFLVFLRYYEGSFVVINMMLAKVMRESLRGVSGVAS